MGYREEVKVFDRDAGTIQSLHFFEPEQGKKSSVKFSVSDEFCDIFQAIDYRGEAHFRDKISNSITANSISFKILQGNLPEQAKEVIVSVLEDFPQLKTVEYPLDFFNFNQNQRISKLLAPAAEMPAMPSM